MSEQTDKESPEEFRAAFKEVLQAYRVTLNMLVENFPRTVTSQALSQSLSITNKRNTSPLPQSMKEDLIDGLIAVIGKDALKKRVSYSNESEEYIFSYAKAYYSRLEQQHSLTQEDLSLLIDAKIFSAKSEVTFIGDLSKRYLNKVWYDKIIELLNRNPKLNISLFIESKQHLFWRSLSLDPSSDYEVRTFKDLELKYEKLSEELISYICSGDLGDSRRERINIYEVDVPIYTHVIRIDDTLFLTPRSHCRGSSSITFQLCENDRSGLWKHWLSYCDYFSDLVKRCSGLISNSGSSSDKTIVYTQDGSIPVGTLNRNLIVENLDLTVRVAHGLIFDREGRMLICRRTPNKSRDNLDNWDKSFGANQTPYDNSLLDAVNRRLKDEIFSSLMADLDQVYIDSKVNFMGRLDPKFLKKTKGCYAMNEWYCWLLNDKQVRFPSNRVLKNEENVYLKNIYANIYIYLCDDSFKKALAESMVGDKYFRWINVRSKEECTAYVSDATYDLECYLDSEDIYLDELKKISFNIKSLGKNNE